MRQRLLCLLVANLFAASAALAQDMRVSGSVSAGGISTDDGDARNPYKLYEYRDLDDGVLFGFDVKGRGSRYWFDLFGENLGRDDQYVNLRGGVYDVFKYRLYSDSLRHNFVFNGRTPYNGAGSDALRTTFPRLDPNVWNTYDSGYKRRDDGGYFEFQGVSPWYVRADANQVSWKGSKPGSSSQGTSPGNGFTDLLFPVEYTTRTATFEGGYNTRALLFNVSYMVSKFDNDHETITWTNGYYGNGIDTSYEGSDNRYERAAANVSVRDLPGNGTLSARFTMDELKNTVQLAQQMLGDTSGGYVSSGANATTYTGEVKHKTFTASYAFMPARQVDGRVYYNYRDREDDSTPVAYYGVHIAEPYDYETSNAGFDVFWRFDRGNRLGFGFDYNDTKREGRWDYDRTKDKRLFVEYKNTMLDELAGRLKYTHLERDSSFLLANSGTGPTDVNYWNRYVTAFDLANVKQDQVKLTLDWTPAPNWDVSFEGIVKRNDFEQNTLGRLSDDRSEIYMTASYGQAGGPRLTFFGDIEKVEYKSKHRVVGDGAQGGAYEPSTAPTASNYNWNGKVEEENWAVGVAFDWPVSEKFAIKASAIHYKTDGMVDLQLQDGVPTSVTRPVPVSYFDDTKKTSFTVKGVYDFTKAFSLTAGYAYERYEYSDEQYNGYRYTITASSNQNSYLSGTYAQPQYKANIFYALVTWRF